MKCCEMWDRRKLKIYKPILLPSTGELRSREVVRVWRPLRTHKMLKKQYENTFSNWLKQRQSFLSDKNESIRANEQEEEGQLKSTYLPPSVADANINETPKLRHWLAERNVGSRDPTRKWQEEVAWSKNPRFHNAQHEWTLSAFQLSPPQRFRLGIPYRAEQGLRMCRDGRGLESNLVSFSKGFSKRPHILAIIKVDSEYLRFSVKLKVDYFILYSVLVSTLVIFLLLFSMNERRRTNESSLQ